MPTDSFPDIAFLLIVFFLLVTTLLETKGFKTDIPAGEKSESKEEELPTVTLLPDRILYNEGEVSIEELRKILDELDLEEKEEKNERLVMLVANDKPVWKQYYPVWAAIAEHGGVVAMVEEVQE